MSVPEIISACDNCPKYKDFCLVKLSASLRGVLCLDLPALVKSARAEEALKSKINGKCQVEPDLLYKIPEHKLN